MDKYLNMESLEQEMREYVPDNGRIGMVVAVEMSAVKRRYGLADHVFEYPGYSVYLYDLKRICEDTTKKSGELYVISSGPGEINAAAATQFLISNHFVDVVLNFGVAGGLSEEVGVGDVFIVDKIVHYSFDCSEYGNGWKVGKHSEYESIFLETDRNLYDFAQKAIGLEGIVCGSGDRFVGNDDSRRSLCQQFGAKVTEMEGAGIFMTADKNGVPSLFIKAVSDTVGTKSREMTMHFDMAADKAMEAIHKVIIFLCQG